MFPQIGMLGKSNLDFGWVGSNRCVARCKGSNVKVWNLLAVLLDRPWNMDQHHNLLSISGVANAARFLRTSPACRFARGNAKNTGGSMDSMCNTLKIG